MMSSQHGVVLASASSLPPPRLRTTTSSFFLTGSVLSAFPRETHSFFARSAARASVDHRPLSDEPMGSPKIQSRPHRRFQQRPRRSLRTLSDWASVAMWHSHRARTSSYGFEKDCSSPNRSDLSSKHERTGHWHPVVALSGWGSRHRFGLSYLRQDTATKKLLDCYLPLPQQPRQTTTAHDADPQSIQHDRRWASARSRQRGAMATRTLEACPLS